MFEIILNWIRDNYPLIFVAIILIAITWFVAKKVFYVKRKINEHDKNIDKQNELIEKIEKNPYDYSYIHEGGDMTSCVDIYSIFTLL